MSIQQSYSPDLSTDEVFKYLITVYNSSDVYTGPVPERLNHRIINSPKNVDTFQTKVIYAIREFYSLTEGDNPVVHIGNTDVILPVEQIVWIKVRAYLLIRTDLDVSPTQEDILAKAFQDYKFPDNGNLSTFLDEMLKKNPDINENMFSVDYAFSLQKDGHENINPKLRDSAFNLWKGKVEGTIKPGPGGVPEEKFGPHDQENYFKKRHFRPTLLRREFLKTFPDRVKSPYEIEQPKDASPDDINEIINSVVDREWETLGCSKYTIRDNRQRIASLLEFPEFKVVIENRPFVIARNCGVEIVVIIPVPVLKIRISSINLWVNLRYSEDTLDKVGLRIVERCLWHAVLAGAVIGIALQNFAAAVAAFKAIFQNCVKSDAEGFVECLLPEIFLLTEVKDDWRDVI